MKKGVLEKLQEESRERHFGKDRDFGFVGLTKITIKFKKGVDEALLEKQKKIKEIAAKIESKL